VYIAARGADGLLWWSTVDTGKKAQSDWNQLSGLSPSPMSISVSGTTIYVAARGADDLLWWSTVDTN